MLQIDDLVFNAWGRRFFDHASVLVPSNAKVGLVGRNGVGKTTLFRLIQGELAPDQGDFLLPRGARIASVDQEHPATPVSLLDTILAADEQRDTLQKELEVAEPERIADIDPISKSNAHRATNIRSKVVGSARSQIGGAKNGRYRRHHRP
jgi:ATP-binding cassette, subfamily F, member 3